MKAFILLLLAAAFGIGGYLYWPQIQQFVEEANPGETAPILVDTGTIPIPPQKTVIPAPVPKLENPSQSEIEAELDKAMAQDEPRQNKIGAATRPDYSAELEKKFPMPTIKRLEDAVGNWTKIPKTALPQTITTDTDITITLPGGAGESTVKAGTQVVAVAANSSGLLSVAPSKGSKARGRVKMEDTDFKEVLTRVYEDFATRKKEEILAKRETERRKLETTDIMRSEGVTSGFEIIGSKPEADSEGRVDAMIASIKAKDVTEFSLDSIKLWTPILFNEIEGQPYWTATVMYEANTIFGKFDAEAMALMQKGSVKKWIYAGSGEPVP